MEITIYSTATCSGCHELTGWLDKKGLPYTKKVTDEDPAVMAEFMAVNDGMIGVPFTIIRDNQGSVIKISGFNQGKFREALAL